MTELTEVLLAQGCDPDALEVKKNTSLQVAVHAGHLPIVKTLIEHGINMDQLNSHGVSALTIAAYCGQDDIVQLLLNHGAKVEPFKITALNTIYEVIKNCDVAVLKTLIKQHNININHADDMGCSIVTAIVRHRSAAYLQALHEDYPVQYVGRTEYSPLVLAIMDDQDETAQWIITHVPEYINYRCQSFLTPTFAALKKDNLAIMRMLLEHKVNLTHYNIHVFPPLVQACYVGSSPFIELFLEFGGDPNIQVDDFFLDESAGENFHLVIEIPSFEMLTDEQQGTISCSNATLLDFAVLLNHRAAVQTLLTHGAYGKLDYRGLIETTEQQKPLSVTDTLPELVPTSLSPEPEPATLEPSPAPQQPLTSPSSTCDVLQILHQHNVLSCQKRREKFKSHTKGIPEQDIDHLVQSLHDADDQKIKEVCFIHMMNRKMTLQKITRFLHSSVSADNKNPSSAANNITVPDEWQKASLPTLKKMAQRIPNPSTDQYKKSASLNLKAPLLRPSSFSPSFFDGPCRYQGYAIAEFPSLLYVRQAQQLCIIPHIDNIVDGEYNYYSNEFRLTLQDPKLAGNTGSGLKRLEGNHFCKVEVKGKEVELPIEYEIKVHGTDARILCYSLKPDGKGPIILIPAVYKAHGLHNDKDKKSNQILKALALEKVLKNTCHDLDEVVGRPYNNNNT